jgi:hypothetical protein
MGLQVSAGPSQPVDDGTVLLADQRVLPSDDFAVKHQLNTEADALRRQLSKLGDGDPDTLRQWAERSAGKPLHTLDDGVEAAKAGIVSPIEGGGESA